MTLEVEVVERLGLAWKTVHGGAAAGWVKKDSELPCNAFCRGGLHCDLFYTAAIADEEDALALCRTRNSSVRTVRVERATEAPPKDPARFWDWRSSELEADTAWLMFWTPK